MVKTTGMRNVDNKDHSDLRALFAHHDVEIGALATRVGKVEQTIETGFAKVGENFNDSSESSSRVVVK